MRMLRVVRMPLFVVLLERLQLGGRSGCFSVFTVGPGGGGGVVVGVVGGAAVLQFMRLLLLWLVRLVLVNVRVHSLVALVVLMARLPLVLPLLPFLVPFLFINLPYLLLPVHVRLFPLLQLDPLLTLPIFVLQLRRPRQLLLVLRPPRLLQLQLLVDNLGTGSCAPSPPDRGMRAGAVTNALACVEDVPLAEMWSQGVFIDRRHGLDVVVLVLQS